MFQLYAKRFSAIVSALLTAFACGAFALAGTASADDSSSAASQQPFVSDYDSRDWCDDSNDVDWDDCDVDWDDGSGDGTGDGSGDGWDDGTGNGNDGGGQPPIVTEPPIAPPAPNGPSGPTGPVVPPVIQWPAPPHGAVAKIRANGRTAVAPKSAPAPVKAMIKAANRITRKPYKWGGGHATWNDSGYDCSGAVSYVLHAASLVEGSLVSGGLAKWGLKGRGRWVQIYANSGHVFMVVAGLRFDTSGAGERGPRWRAEPRFTKGFKLRHPAGL